MEELRDAGVRLVSLTGLAGVGKTRIAAAAAARVEAETDRTVAWLDVTRVPDAELLEPAIAKAAGIAGWDPGGPGGLGTVLDAAPRLVVLDGFDTEPSEPAMHDRLSELVASARTTRFLLTARTPHRVPGDRLLRVQPLPTESEVGASPAVELFIDVATSVGAATPTPDDLPAIDAVVERLGGNPLAITLAASRATAFSPSTLQDLLERPTPNAMFASSVLAEAGELGTSIDWSVGHLDPDPSALLRDLTAFHGPVPVEAAESICDVDDVIGALSHLVDVHLVDADHSGPVTIFSLPPVVREHVALLMPADARADLRRRHQRWAVDLAHWATATGTGEAHTPAPEIEVVEPDLLVALRRALDVGEADEAGALVVALAPLWLGGLTHETHLELVRRTTALLAADRPRGDALALVHGWHALLLAERASGATALDLIDAERERALELARDCDPIVRLRVLALAVRTGRVYVDRGPLIECCNEARQLALVEGAEDLLARFEVWAAMLAHQEGDLDHALELALAARERALHLEDESLTVTATAFLRTLPESTTAGVGLPSAAQLVRSARACGEHRVVLWTLPAASEESRDAGDALAATRYDIEVMERARDAGAWAWAWVAIISQAEIVAGRGELERAARLHGMVHHHRHILEAMLPPAVLARWHASRDAVRTALGAETYEACAEAGSMRTPSEAATEVLEAARRFLADGDPTGLPESPVDASPLTARELEVLDLLVDGDSNKDIARRLGITPKTVMHHTSSIYRKLGVRGRAEAVAWAVRRAA